MCKFCEKEYILNFKLTFYLFLLQGIVIRTMLLFNTEFQDFWKTKNSVLTNSSGLAKSVRYNRDHGSVIEAYGTIRSFPCFTDMASINVSGYSKKFRYTSDLVIEIIWVRKFSQISITCINLNQRLKVNKRRRI